MSAISPTSQVPSAVMQAAIPKEVREEGTKAVSSYRAALEFESELLQQMLSDALPESATGAEAGGEGEGEESGGSFDPQVTSLPEMVGEEVMSAGGLGLAKEMYGSIGGGLK